MGKQAAKQSASACRNLCQPWGDEPRTLGKGTVPGNASAALTPGMNAGSALLTTARGSGAGGRSQELSRRCFSSCQRLTEALSPAQRRKRSPRRSQEELGSKGLALSGARASGQPATPSPHRHRGLLWLGKLVLSPENSKGCSAQAAATPSTGKLGCRGGNWDSGERLSW